MVGSPWGKKISCIPNLTKVIKDKIFSYINFKVGYILREKKFKKKNILILPLIIIYKQIKNKIFISTKNFIH